MCLYPRIAENKKFIPNKKNRGIPAPISDIRTKYVAIACGECIECRKAKTREWQIRLREEIKSNQEAIFITLTFSNENIKKLTQTIREDINGKIFILSTQVGKEREIQKLKLKTYGYGLDNEICTRANKTLRDEWRRLTKKSVKHWLITELGHKGTENIHMHGILWTQDRETLKKAWTYGHVWDGTNGHGKIVNYVNTQTINYISKYITKKDNDHKHYKSKILCSPAIGKGYINKHTTSRNKYKKNNTIETYRTETGHEIGMPIYYRNKIYTEDEREKLWIEKLNKNERYVLGKKIDTKKTLKGYIKTLKQAQIENKQKGYGNGNINWKEKEYETQHRIMLQNMRIQASGGKI